MADETNIEAKADTAVQAVAKPAAETAAKVEKTVAAPISAPVGKAKRVIAKRRARKAPMKIVEAVRKTNRRAVKSVRRATRATTAATATPIERTVSMTNDFTPLFSAFQFPGQLPGADRFQGLFADAGSKGQELAAKGQKAAEQFGELAKANIEALAEAGRIAATGAKSIGQDALASGRDGLELASQNVKTLAGATSPTEFVQLQSELVRASFDRFVTETSKLTEQVVKLAGEAIQPISNRASINAERVNELMA